MTGGGRPRGPARRVGGRILAVLAILYGLCLLLAPLPSFVTEEEGASWALMDSLGRRWWLSPALVTPAAEIDPSGEFAGPFTKARGGRWYSTVPPLLPLAASIPFFFLGTLGAYAVPAAGAAVCALLAARVGRRFEGGAGAAAAFAAAPLLLHGALFRGDTLAAALVLGSADLFMEACERGLPRSRPSRGALLGASLCAGLAALARFEAAWFAVAAPAAWALLRWGRPRIAISDTPRWRVAFLALTSALQLAIPMAVHVVAGSRGERAASGPHIMPVPGSPLLTPAIVPAALALYGLIVMASQARSRRDSLGVQGRTAEPRGLMLALGPRTWAWIAGAAMLVQAIGFARVMPLRARNAAVVEAVASAAAPGDVVVSEEASLPALCASLASTRALLRVRPGGAPPALLVDLEAAGVKGLVAVSRERPEGEATLALGTSLGRFSREGDPQRVPGFIVARFTGGGPQPVRSSAPPRGD